MTQPVSLTVDEILNQTWEHIEPYYTQLATQLLTPESLNDWLSDWSHLSALISEAHERLNLAANMNTDNTAAEQAYLSFLDQVYTQVEAADQRLKRKLLDSDLEPEGFITPLRTMRAEAELFCDANLPLLNEERKLGNEYGKIVAAQTVLWEGRELTVPQLRPLYQDSDRNIRERAWRLAAHRQLDDRQALNELWTSLLQLRCQVAANAGFANYRDYRWRQLWRFDYTPADCEQFQQAIEEVVVPAAVRIYERRRTQLAVETLRPWDLEVDPLGRLPLRPFTSVTELETNTAAIFDRLNPELGHYFQTMRRDGLLDLENRKGKAPGGFCTSFDVARRPFIFMNAVGVHDDVQTLLHEAGHAFHYYESARLPFVQQWRVGMEFAEVASMSMELLASPYLPVTNGGFYATSDAARARTQHLEWMILFWPYMAVVDSFQHWAYTHPEAARDPDQCDATWSDLWRRFMVGVDWSGLDAELATGWQRKLHIYRVPFYYVEYGLAQLGAVQVWRNALRDEAASIDRYRQALSLGGTQPLPALYEAAGARLAFDATTLREAVNLIEQTIATL